MSAFGGKANMAYCRYGEPSPLRVPWSPQSCIRSLGRGRMHTARDCSDHRPREPERDCEIYSDGRPQASCSLGNGEGENQNIHWLTGHTVSQSEEKELQYQMGKMVVLPGARFRTSEEAYPWLTSSPLAFGLHTVGELGGCTQPGELRLVTTSRFANVFKSDAAAAPARPSSDEVSLAFAQVLP
jgi:hypothetical protein